MCPSSLHLPLPKHTQLPHIKPRQEAAVAVTGSATCILLSHLCTCRLACKLADVPQSVALPSMAH